MKKFATALALSLALAGCRGNTAYGECRGIVDDDEKQNNLVYTVSTRNVVLGLIFSETMLVPAVTAGWYLWCPTSEK